MPDAARGYSNLAAAWTANSEWARMSCAGNPCARAHATRRSFSTCRSHPSSWFQLGKLRLTTCHHFFFPHFSGAGSRLQTGIESWTLPATGSSAARLRLEGNVDFGVATGCRSGNSGGDTPGMLPNLRPLRAACHDNQGDAAGTKVLLVTNPTVRREGSSKPACSAASSSAPLLSVSQPLACAVSTACPGTAPISPFGVP